jgi:hypothetical protein
MEIRYNIINVAEILSQVGKEEIANSIDFLVKQDVKRYYGNSYGVKSCFREFLNNVSGCSEHDVLSNYNVLDNFLNNLDSEKFYDKNIDGIDITYCLENSKNQKLMLTIIDNMNTSQANKLFSDRFADKLFRILDSGKFNDGEGRLFSLELNRYISSSFTKAFDRNFDAKECDGDFEVSYTPKGKNTITTDNNKWCKQGRAKSKFVKAMKKIPFRYEYSSKFYEQLNNSVVAAYSLNISMSEVSGSDIVKYYNEDQYKYGDSSSLGNSCMRHSSCSEFIEFYARNEECVKMVIALDADDKLVGRALLWTTDSGIKLMDRIYGSDVVIEKFKKYALSMDYAHKEEQSYNNDNGWVNGDGLFTEYYDITVNNIYTMPYMDTFKYTNDLTNDKMLLSNRNGDYQFSGTDGCTETYEEADDNYVICARSGDRISRDDAEYIDAHGDHYRSDYCVFAWDTDRYELKIDCVYLEYKDIYVSEDTDVVCIDYNDSEEYGTYVLADDSICLESKEYCLVDESIHNNIDGTDLFISGNVIEVSYSDSLGNSWKQEICDDWYSNEELIDMIIDSVIEEVTVIDLDGEIIYKLLEVVND